MSAREWSIARGHIVEQKDRPNGAHHRLFNVVEATQSDVDLAAAAPDLLAVAVELAEHLARGRCRCTVAEIESGHHVDCWKPDVEEAAERARAAIAKATGGRNA